MSTGRPAEALPSAGSCGCSRAEVLITGFIFVVGKGCSSKDDSTVFKMRMVASVK